MSQLADRARRIKKRWSQFAETDRGGYTLKAGRYIFITGIVAYLGYDLTHIGWAKVGRSLPTHPLFYVIFLVLYFALPVAKVLVYRVTWDFDIWEGFKAFVKKRVYNKEVMGYSGEFYLFAWARRHLSLSDRAVAETIRDQNIVSSAASTVVAVLLLVFFLYEGEVSLSAWLGEQYLFYGVFGGGGFLVVAALAAWYRRYLFAMALQTALIIFAIHCFRLVLGQGLQVLQWAVALPEVPLRVWFTYAAASIIVSRIPFVPSRDLVFMAAGMQLAEATRVSSAGMAGMLVTIAVLGKILNVTFFVLISAITSLRDRRVAAGGDAPSDNVLAEVETDRTARATEVGG